MSGSNPAADEIVEHAGVDRLGSTAASDPHEVTVVGVDDAVHVRRVGGDPEIARRRALEQEPRLGAELRGDGVALVAPGAEPALGGKRACDAIERVGTRRGVDKIRRECDAVGMHYEDIGHGREPRRPRVVEPAHGRAIDQERPIGPTRRRERARESVCHRYGDPCWGSSVHCSPRFAADGFG